MSLFKYNVELDEPCNCVSLVLTQENDTNDTQTFDLVYPDIFFDMPDLRIYVAVQMAHWINSVGKAATFKQIAKQFEKCCKDAEKLKIVI